MSISETLNLEDAPEKEQESISSLIPLEEAGNYEAAIIGGKAHNLGRLLAAGLPVPEGYAVSVAEYKRYKKIGKVSEGFIHDLTIIREQLGGKIALRSSATCEDGEEISMAGVFSSFYLGETDDLEKTVKKIYDQADSTEVGDYLRMHNVPSEDMQMGLVIQRLIEPEFSGVIYTNVNSGQLLVQYVEGFGASLVDGEGHGSSLLIDSSGAISESSNYSIRPLPETAVHSIPLYAQLITQVFDNPSQDIEFAYKDQALYLLQSRSHPTPLENVTLSETVEDTLENTRIRLHQLVQKEKEKLGVERVIFSDSNYSELLPHPTEMDFGVFNYLFGANGAIQEGRKEMGYSLGIDNYDYLQYIGGRPYFSIARDALTFYAGFPGSEREYLDTLVQEYLLKVEEDPSKGIYPEMGLYLQDPSFEDLLSRYGEKGTQYHQIYLDFKVTMASLADTFLDEFYSDKLPAMQKIAQANEDRLRQIRYINEQNPYQSKSGIVEFIEGDILDRTKNIFCRNFVKAARLGFYYSQRMRTFLHAATGSDEKADTLFAKLSQGLDGSMITLANIAIAKAETDEEAYEIAREQVGHFSTREMLEIRHPLLRDEPEALKAYVDGIRAGDYEAQFEKQKAERLKTEAEVLQLFQGEDRETVRQTIHSAQQYMALRETIKYYFVREYAVLRDTLEFLSEVSGLPEDDMYYVYPQELSTVTADPTSYRHLINARRRAFSHYESLAMPHVIKESDISSLGLIEDENMDFTELSGKFLAQGESITGVVLNVDEFENPEDIEAAIHHFREQQIPIILTARQLNLGHDPYLALAAGLVLENAGIVSHGAQRARELGKGAIGGIRSAYLRTGMEIVFNPQKRTIYKGASI